MGYRVLLKNYMRLLESHTGSNFIETLASEPESPLPERDVRELRAIAAEIYREEALDEPSAHAPS